MISAGRIYTGSRGAHSRSFTLNVLLSFAQFERELTTERIRDKFAASRRRGIFMGGNPPLGYDPKDRKLVINEQEAEKREQPSSSMRFH